MVHHIGNISSYYAQLYSQKQDNTSSTADTDNTLQQLIASLMNNAPGATPAPAPATNTSKGPCSGAASSASNISSQNLLQLANANNTDTPEDALYALLQGMSSAMQSGTAQLSQSLFQAIDANGDGSITKDEMEQAVTKAGGTAQSADALFAKLDPNNTGSITAQQLAQNMPQAAHHHHHHGGGGGKMAQQLEQSLFSAMDTNDDGSVTQTELEQSVTQAGGTTQSADSLYAMLDPDKTGSFTSSALNELI